MGIQSWYGNDQNKLSKPSYKVIKKLRKVFSKNCGCFGYLKVLKNIFLEKKYENLKNNSFKGKTKLKSFNLTKLLLSEIIYILKALMLDDFYY